MRPEIYKDEGYKLMGAAFEVYNDRGYGLGEEIYQECLEIELELRGIPFKAKQELTCHYKGARVEEALCSRFICLRLSRRGTKICLPAFTRTRGAINELHAHHKTAGWVSDQLWTQGRFGVEANHPFRIYFKRLASISAD